MKTACFYPHTGGYEKAEQFAGEMNRAGFGVALVGHPSYYTQEVRYWPELAKATWGTQRRIEQEFGVDR